MSALCCRQFCAGIIGLKGQQASPELYELCGSLKSGLRDIACTSVYLLEGYEFMVFFSSLILTVLWKALDGAKGLLRQTEITGLSFCLFLGD